VHAVDRFSSNSRQTTALAWEKSPTLVAQKTASHNQHAQAQQHTPGGREKGRAGDTSKTGQRLTQSDTARTTAGEYNDTAYLMGLKGIEQAA